MKKRFASYGTGLPVGMPMPVQLLMNAGTAITSSRILPLFREGSRFRVPVQGADT